MAKTDSISGEEWRAVEGHEGMYEVSSLGRVRSLVFRNRNIAKPRVKILKPINVGNGYYRVNLSKDNKPKLSFVHRIVLQTFRGPAPEGHVGMHLNGCPSNNALSNLAWGPYTENESHKIIHGTKIQGSRQWFSQITEAQASEIRRLVASGSRQYRVAALFGVSRTVVWCIVHRKSWKHVS